MATRLHRPFCSSSGCLPGRVGGRCGGVQESLVLATFAIPTLGRPAGMEAIVGQRSVSMVVESPGTEVILAQRTRSRRYRSAALFEEWVSLRADGA
jgi:hypothetical protein